MQKLVLQLISCVFLETTTCKSSNFSLFTKNLEKPQKIYWEVFSDKHVSFVINWPNCVRNLTFSRRLTWKSSQLSVEVFSLFLKVVLGYFCNWKLKLKYLFYLEDFRFLFRDSGQTFSYDRRLLLKSSRES